MLFTKNILKKHWRTEPPPGRPPLHPRAELPCSLGSESEERTRSSACCFPHVCLGKVLFLGCPCHGSHMGRDSAAVLGVFPGLGSDTLSGRDRGHI